jgi:Domain of unknown function (DUF4190)
MTVPNVGQPEKASSQAVTALVLGILGLLCCPILGPIAWYMGNQERKAVRERRSPASGEGLAVAGMVLGILGTLYLLFAMMWIFFMGGMAILSGMAQGWQ